MRISRVTTLPEAALDHARASGIALVRLRAPSAALAFWEALGFVALRDVETATHRLLLFDRVIHTGDPGL